VAAALALRGSDASVAAVWVMAPALDATLSGSSYAEFAEGTGRTAAEFAYLWSLYVPDAAARASADVSPALADLAGCPPLFVYPAEFDPARSDGEDFAARAEAAGVAVVLRRRAGLIHQYPEITGVSAASRQAVEDAARELAAAFA
jgi:acetyl esterase